MNNQMEENLLNQVQHTEETCRCEKMGNAWEHDVWSQSVWWGAANLELDSLPEPRHTCLGNELSTNNYLVILVRLQNQVLFCIVLFFFSSFQRLELNPGLEHTRQSLYHWVIIPVQVTVPLNLAFFIYKRIPILCQHYYECSIRFYVVINYTIYKYYSQYKTSHPRLRSCLIELLY